MQVTHGVSLTEDQILFFTELLVLTHAASLCMDEVSKRGDESYYLALLISCSAEDHVRSLLHGPLRNVEFRTKFNTHFDTHPSKRIRETGFAWLQDVLNVES